MPKQERVGWDIDAERDIWRAICAPNHWFAEDGVTPSTHGKSLYYFVRICWGVDWYFKAHPEQAMWFYEPIHGPYIDWLQTHLLRWKEACRKGYIAERYYIASVLPRGYGKTVIASKSSDLWTHLDEPDMSSLICSATGELARDILSAIKAVISGEDNESWFCWLYGNWKKGATTWNKENVVHGYRQSKNLSEGSFDTTGVDSGMTGYHHRKHNWDDPLTVNKMRESGLYLTAAQTAVDASYNALQMNGLLMLTLTRYKDGDIAGRHFKEEGIASWDGMECPNMALFEKIPMGKGEWHVFFYQTEDELTGEPTHPVLWTKKKIAEAKRRDPEDFACQQQNNPGTGERAPLLESQIPSLFVDYRDFLFTVPVEAASVHIDTAFKRLQTVRQGDYNAIGVWLHDARRTGVLYLDTDLLRNSNEWREEEFNDELVKVFLNLRKRRIHVKKLTDEVEPGGKAGSYKNRILSVLKVSGIRLHDRDFIQYNRTVQKEARIRTATGHWAEGWVRILLHKDVHGEWIIPPIVRVLINQILRVDVVDHKDLADALSDGFSEGIWIRPEAPFALQQEGEYPVAPGDDDLRNIGQPLSNEEVFEMMDDPTYIINQTFPDSKELHTRRGGSDSDDEWTLPREPV